MWAQLSEDAPLQYQRGVLRGEFSEDTTGRYKLLEVVLDKRKDS